MKLDILKLFTREEPIAGLEISDSFLRIALLDLETRKLSKKNTDPEGSSQGTYGAGETQKEEKIITVKAFREKPLKEGIIVNGEIKDMNGLVAALKELLKEIKPRINYAIVSILADNIYSRFYSFPKTLSGEKLEETMNLTIGFQLPVDPGKVYLDWEKLESKEKNEIFLAAIPKVIVDVYMEAFVAAGLRTVAVEFYPISVSRVINVPENGNVLTIIFSKDKADISIIVGKTVRFNRLVPLSRFSDAVSFSDEIRKIADFYESESSEGSRQGGTYGASKNSISKIALIGGNRIDISGLSLPVSQAEIISPFSEHSEIKKDSSRWLISVGAALRGILPRHEDTLVSLMPIGTEQAYENQKAVAFAGFISSITVGLSIFFSVAFIGVWILMISVQQGFRSRLESLNSLPLPVDAAELENRAKNFNGLIADTGGILRNLPKWSGVLEELKARVIPGVIITNFSMPSSQDAINMTGVAQNRSQLNMFKKILEESPMFTAINMPLTNIELRENVPFSLSFKLKNPGALYNGD